MAKAKVDQITITRKEWRTDDAYGSDGPIVVHTWQDASACLARIAATSPDNGCYDKTDFCVRWANGEEYTGRADVTREHASGYDLGSQIEKFLGLVSGTKAPAGWDPARFAAHQASQSPAHKRAALRILKECQIECTPPGSLVPAIPEPAKAPQAPAMPPDRNPGPVKLAATRAWRFATGIQPRPEPFPSTVDVTLDDVCAALGIAPKVATRAVCIAENVAGFPVRPDARFRN